MLVGSILPALSQHPYPSPAMEFSRRVHSSCRQSGSPPSGLPVRRSDLDRPWAALELARAHFLPRSAGEVAGSGVRSTCTGPTSTEVPADRRRLGSAGTGWVRSRRFRPPGQRGLRFGPPRDCLNSRRGAARYPRDVVAGGHVR